MDSADGEYYLRRCGEDGLERRHSSADLHQRARALAALDVVSPMAAATILADYERARFLRGLIDDGHRADDEIAEAWAPPTIRTCGQTLPTQWGTITLHHVTIGPDESEIEVAMHQSPPAPGQRRGRAVAMPFPDEVPDLAVTDDKGNPLSGGFRGGQDGREWLGSYAVHPTLDPAARFITVMGHRVELGPSPNDVSVEVTEVDPSQPVAERAARYLRRCLAAPSTRHFPDSAVALAMDTFVECGILAADAEVIAQATQARELAERAVPGMPPRGGRASGSRRSSRGKAQLGNRSVGASVSLPGGVHVAVTDLRATPDAVTVGFRAAVTTRESMVRSLSDCLAMTATDDAGVEHAGVLGDWGFGGGNFHGRMRIGPPPGPGASTLNLRIRTDRADVLLVIPLRWDGGQ